MGRHERLSAQVGTGQHRSAQVSTGRACFVTLLPKINQLVLYESLAACMEDGENVGGGFAGRGREKEKIREQRIQEYINIIMLFIRDLFQRNLTVTAVCRLPQDDDD